MAISFNSIPNNIRVPFMAVEIDNAGAAQGESVKNYRILLIGQKLAAGTQAANDPVQIFSSAQAQTYFGRGSQLAAMAAASLKDNPYTDTWAVAVDDAGSAAAATATLTVTGTPTAAGTIYLYIGGQRLMIGVSATDTLASIATNIAAAITAAPDVCASASAAEGVVTLTAKNAGEAGNKIDVRINHFVGEVTPPGITVALTAFDGGSGNPDITDTLALLGDVQYDFIAMPYTDAANLQIMENFLQDRWGPLQQNEGFCFVADNGKESALAELGNSRNSPFTVIIPAFGVPNTVWEVAANLCGICAYYLSNDPARQLRGLASTYLTAPKQTDRFIFSERNALLYDGVSSIAANDDGQLAIERIITTYKTNSAGAEDTSYLDIMSPVTVAYLRYDWRTYIMNKYPRSKLADDGTRYGNGQAIITPKIGKAEALARFNLWMDNGLVEGADQFKRDLICERNASDPNRLDWFLSPDIVNNFMIGGTKIGFILQALAAAQ
jgi:phage tail sheath gpL-like